jgi:hypothetical protein
MWQTLIESEEWRRWENEQARRRMEGYKENCYDMDECKELGVMGTGH